MKNYQDQKNKTEYILDQLSGIGEIIIRRGLDGSSALVKAGAVFAYIRGQKLSMLNQDNEFEDIADEIIENRDHFLQLATKSYWYATGKKL